MERGVRRNTIFQDDIDYKYFLKILRKCAEKNECYVHAYCLMSNHFHLLLETGNIKISDFMRDLATKYAMYYNRKYELKGHVFEGRYKSCYGKKKKDIDLEALKNVIEDNFCAVLTNTVQI